jgi:uridine kinase
VAPRPDLIRDRDTTPAFAFAPTAPTYHGADPLSLVASMTAPTTAATAVRPKPLIVGIAGGTGSGKSTVARKVAESLAGASAAFLDMDAYYRNFGHLPMEERRRVNWDHPAAFDTELLASHLERLVAGESVDKPVYDFVSHTRSPRTERIAPGDVVVIDGILLFVDERVRELCDVKVFVDTDADVRLIRRIRRDMAKRGRPLDEILEQYLSTVQPMHLQFVEPSKRYADVIVPRGGHNAVAIEMIVAKIQRRLSAQQQFRG